jgi:transposase
MEAVKQAGMGSVRHGQPLPLRPAGSVAINQAADLLETEEGGVVFIWGMASLCFAPGDIVGRRLAAVTLVATGAGLAVEVAKAFGVEPETLRCWRRSFEASGVAGLEPARRGPKGPFKLTDDKRAEILRLRAGGASLRVIGRKVSLDPGTVRTALAEGTLPQRQDHPQQAASGAGLEPLSRPAERGAERQAARAGVMSGAEPVICEGASLPLAGALLVLPALVVGGLVDVFGEVYGTSRAAFYSLRSLVLTLVFAALVGASRAEGLTRIDPVDLGRLIGLDRAPEVATVRRRIEELAGLQRTDELYRLLAERHLQAVPEACGLFYVDGHVRSYHGSARLPKAHIARARIAGPGEEDTWITDARGDGVLCWTGEPGKSLAGELARATTEIRRLVGPDARPTVAFDRGGYSPKLFAELVASGFDILTYRKAPTGREPLSAFERHSFTDDLGRDKAYWLADRNVRLAWKDGSDLRHFSCRQVTRLDPDSGHQTQVLTTRRDLASHDVAYAMFSRWREENFFRYMRENFSLDALDSYAKIPDDPTRTVPNPAKKAAARKVADAKAVIDSAHASEGRDVLSGGRTTKEVVAAFAGANEELTARKAAARAIPARVPLGEVHPDAVVFSGERKRVHDAIRMATYNASSALARLLRPHYTRAEDEARMLLSEAFRTPGDLEIVGDELHLRINPLSAPRRSRAIAGLCEELNATETLYPGTELRLVYSVKGC